MSPPGRGVGWSGFLGAACGWSRREENRAGAVALLELLDEEHLFGPLVVLLAIALEVDAVSYGEVRCAAGQGIVLHVLGAELKPAGRVEDTPFEVVVGVV